MAPPVGVEGPGHGTVGAEGRRGVGPLRKDGRAHRPERRAGGGGKQGPRVPGRKGRSDGDRREGAATDAHLPEDDLLASVRVDAHGAPPGQDAERAPRRELDGSPRRTNDVAPRPGGCLEVGVVVDDSLFVGE